MNLPEQKRQQFIIVCALIFLAWPHSFADTQKRGQDNEPALDVSMLKSAIQKAVADSPDLLGMKLGLVVKDLQRESLLYSKNPGQKFNIASNTKIITAIAALDTLGPEFRLRTSIVGHLDREKGTVTQGITIRGKGDPSFWQEDLSTLVRQLKHKGVRKIAGRILIDDTYFDDDQLPPHYSEQPHEHAGFRAPVSSTSFNFNSFQVHIRPGNKDNDKAIAWVSPPNHYVKLKNEVLTVQKGRQRLRTKIAVDKNNTTVSLEGTLRLKNRGTVRRYRAEHPKKFLHAAFIQELKAQGIKYQSNKAKPSKPDTPQTLLAAHNSPPLAVIIRGMGKYSNNFVAETLLKIIGAESLQDNHGATWDNGLEAVRNFLKTKTGLNPKDYKYENGSGLFSSSLFSPEQMIKILEYASGQFEWRSDFVSSLAISGKDGTLANRMIGTNATGKIRAKTGTLATSSALSGYVSNAEHKPVAFALFMNDIPKGKIPQARQLQDDLMSLIVRYISNTHTAKH